MRGLPLAPLEGNGTRLGRLAALGTAVFQLTQFRGSRAAQMVAEEIQPRQAGHLHSNRLTGEIPKELGDLSDLEGLWLQRNSLTGEIPPELGRLSNLKWLWLYGNELEGSIPPGLDKLSSLVQLNLHSNRLTGEIPKELGDLSGLEGM